MTRKARIYIAGPLNAMAVDYLKNVHNMIQTAERVRRAGYAVYVPAIDLLMGIVFGNYGYEEYFQNSQPWLDAADGVFLCEGWEKSSGTRREIDRANSRNIPCVHDLGSLTGLVPVEIDDAPKT